MQSYKDEKRDQIQLEFPEIKASNMLADNNYEVLPWTTMIKYLQNFFSLRISDQLLLLKKLNEYLKTSAKIRKKDNACSFLTDIIEFHPPIFPNQILHIFRDAQSFGVLEEVLDVICTWLYLDFGHTIWQNEEGKDFITKLTIIATPPTENTKVTPRIFEKSISILSFFATKDDDFIQILNLNVLMNRISLHFNKNIFPKSRLILSQFIERLFNVQTLNFDIKDVFVLGSMFSLLPTSIDTMYFPSLMHCASHLIKLSQEFAHSFIENVDVQQIFSSLVVDEKNPSPSVPQEAKRSIIFLMTQFIQTGDQTLIDLALPFFKWPILLSDLQEPPKELNEDNLKSFDDNFAQNGWDVINLLMRFPQLANEPDAGTILEYLLFFFHNKSCREKVTGLTVLAKMVALRNPNIITFLIEHDYIESALDLLEVVDDSASLIIDSLHHIAEFAEAQSAPEIIDRMIECEIINILIKHADSENQTIGNSAAAFLNDKDLTYFHSLVPPPP